MSFMCRTDFFSTTKNQGCVKNSKPQSLTKVLHNQMNKAIKQHNRENRLLKKVSIRFKFQRVKISFQMSFNDGECWCGSNLKGQIVPQFEHSYSKGMIVVCILKRSER